MDKSKVLGGFVVLIYTLFVIFLFSGHAPTAYYLGALLCPIVALMYFLLVKRKSIGFTLFLIFFSISDLMTLFINYIPNTIDYIIGNGLYILAYSSLIFEICNRVCVLNILKSFKLHLLILTALNIYIVYKLNSSVDVFQVNTKEFFIELVYNIVMLLLLTIALLNYLYKDDRKSLLLFIGALCVVFAEVVQVTYLYITNQQDAFLNFISVTLYLAAFAFFYKQSVLRHTNTINRFISEEA